jgi:hypothetical protein
MIVTLLRSADETMFYSVFCPLTSIRLTGHSSVRPVEDGSQMA